MTKETNRESDIVPTDTWINLTKSGKGFIIVVKDDFKKGDILLGSIVALEEFLTKERTGINLGQLIPKE